MNHPRISIVTPTFNQAEFLEQTIDSVLGQSYPNLEYIIVDGGSTDSSVDIIRKYEKHLSFWVSEKDQGMYDAIHKGFQHSTGDIMAWINSDDMYHKNAFTTVERIFGSFPEVQWFQGNPTTFDRSGHITLAKPLRRWSKYNFYTGDYKWIQQESTFWKRSLWEKAGSRMNAQMKYAGDFELWLRFFRHERLFVSNAIIGGFRISSKNQLSFGHLKSYLDELDKCLEAEVFDSVVRKKILQIKRCKKLLDTTSRVNIGSLKLKYHRLFEYPPQIVFNTAIQEFELVPAEGFTY
jgi:glycosyltransferase involved in cell wall biosynthesis